MDTLKLDERIIENQAVIETKWILENVKDGKELSNIIKSRDTEPPIKDNGMSPKAHAAYWSLWNFFGIHKVFRDTIEDKFKDASEQAVNLYSCFAASTACLEYLKKFNPLKKKSTGLDIIDFSSEGDSILKTIAKNHIAAMKSPRSSDDLLSSAYSHFEYLYALAKDESRETKYSSFKSQLTSYPIEISENCVIYGFSTQEKKYIEDSPDLKWEYIVGNEKAIAMLQTCLRNMFLYNPSKKINPLKDEISRLLIFHGPPGTGKSLMIRTAINEGYKLSKRTGIPFTHRVIDNRVKNRFVGASHENLEKHFNEVCDPSGVGFTFVDDYDMVFPPRHSGTSQESDLELEGDYMNFISGLKSVDTGNNFNIIAVNDKSRVDWAVDNRAVTILCEGPVTLKDYEKLIRIVTKEKKKFFDFDESNGGNGDGYIEIAKLLHEYDDKGRWSDNFKRLMNTFTTNGPPDSVFDKPTPESRYEEYKKYSKKLGVDELKGLLHGLKEEAKKEAKFAPLSRIKYQGQLLQDNLIARVLFEAGVDFYSTDNIKLKKMIDNARNKP